MILRVKKLYEDALIPLRAHPGDAGLDLFAYLPNGRGTNIIPGNVMLVKTGIAIELPSGYEAQIRPRSGLALKHGVTVLNTPGTIDEGYRGEIGVILINHGKNLFAVSPGMKIAQLVVKPITPVEIELVEEMTDTQRGSGGFGSTGYTAG